MIIFMIFVMASALAPNIGAQLAFRFLAGVFGSTPLTCAGGSISDLWGPLEKTYSFPIFAIGGFAGPALGPVIASYIGVGNIGTWRWTEWVTLIMAGLVLTIIFFFQIETYPPLLLKWKAQHLRKLTGDDRFRAELEVTETTLWTRLKTSMARPFLFMQEPIVLFMTLYLTVLYIILFTFLDGYTYIFGETYGIGQGLTNVIFAAMFVGMATIAMLVPWVYKKTKKELEQNRTETGTHIDPEIRLWYAMLAAPTIPISLFWMGWTAYVSTFYKYSCNRAN
jgi:MFS family permease